MCCCADERWRSRLQLDRYSVWQQKQLLRKCLQLKMEQVTQTPEMRGDCRYYLVEFSQRCFHAFRHLLMLMLHCLHLLMIHLPHHA